MIDREAIVRQMFKAMEDPDPAAAAKGAASHIAPDGKFYEQVGLQAVVGPEDCEAWWSDLFANLSDLRIEILHIATDGNTVLAEREDSFVRVAGHREYDDLSKQGDNRSRLRVTGVGEVNDDGKIVEWRDYFCPLDRLIPQTVPAGIQLVD